MGGVGGTTAEVGDGAAEGAGPNSMDGAWPWPTAARHSPESSNRPPRRRRRGEGGVDAMPAGGRAVGARFTAAGALLRGRPHQARGRRGLVLRGRRALRLRQFGLLCFAPMRCRRSSGPAGASSEAEEPVLLLPLPCHAAEEREASPLAGAGGESDAGGGADVGGMGERE
jgi:hypothetical protein